VRSRNALIQERIAALQELDEQQRSAYARERGLTESDVTLLLSPGRCGKLSEGDLERFAAGAPEMSVGFVSAAAGILQVAQLLRCLRLGAVEATRGGAMAVATFARAKVRSMYVGEDQACDCVPLLRNRWQGLWPASYRA
jgi:hypothetical protein